MEVYEVEGKVCYILELNTITDWKLNIDMVEERLEVTVKGIYEEIVGQKEGIFWMWNC